MTDTTETTTYPKAKATFGVIRITVKCCPYCQRTHFHNYPAESGQRRLADCFRGEYVLDFEEADK